MPGPRRLLISTSAHAPTVIYFSFFPFLSGLRGALMSPARKRAPNHLRRGRSPDAFHNDHPLRSIITINDVLLLLVGVGEKTSYNTTNTAAARQQHTSESKQKGKNQKLESRTSK